jgi:hypothetical protein
LGQEALQELKEALINMGVCWYCHWGWPEQVVAIYQKYLPLIGESGLDYGPGHIVWADENFEAESVQWCIDNADKYRHEGLTDEQHALCVDSLKELLALPEDIREAEPKEYEGENPELYPPREGLVMSKHN